jgi:hypothetical protein
MGDNEYKLLYEAIEKADSDIIIFLIVLGVLIVVALVPLYGLILKDRKSRRSIDSKHKEMEIEAAHIRQDKYIEREQQVIKAITDVVTRNSEAMSGLKSTLDNSGQATIQSLNRVHDRIDDHISDHTKIAQKHTDALSAINEKVDNMVKLTMQKFS